MKLNKLLTSFALLCMAVTSQAQVTYTALSNIANDKDSESAAMLLDGNQTTKWYKSISNENPCWIIFKTSEAINPVKYILTEANDTHDSQGRQWQKWKIYGGTFADDATAAAATGSEGWTLLDQKAGIDNVAFPVSASNNTYQETAFSMSESNSTAYTYFKLVVEECRSGAAIQMADFRFLTAISFTCTAGSKYNNGAESCDKAFDGEVSTKWLEGAPGANGRYALFHASQPIYVWGYDITTGNDTETYGRLPKQWQLYGANTDLAYDDAEGWTELSNSDVSGENDYIIRMNYFTQRFFCKKSETENSYQYFKLVIPEPNGDMQISEFQLCYETQPAVTYSWKESTGDETGSKKAVDLLINQKWEAGSNGLSGKSLTIETDDDASHSVKSYSFSTHDDGLYTDRAPKTWIVEGSDDNSTWTTIHEVTTDSAAIKNYVKSRGYTTFEFTPTCTTDAFKYIRLTLNSMKGTGHNQLGEFHVVGGCTKHAWEYTSTVAATCTSEGGDEYICSLCGARKVGGTTTAKTVHSYVGGFCSTCGIRKVDYMTTVDNYYEASDASHLKWLAAKMNDLEDGNFNVKLTADIDLKDSGFNGFSNGSYCVVFKGEFDGNEHWLNNLKVEANAQSQVGLFGKVTGADIHDLGLSKAYVKVTGDYSQNAAFIAGRAEGSTTTINRVAVMNGSYVEGFDHVASIAGYVQDNTTISNCLSDAEVHSTTYQAGGLVGVSRGLTLETCLFRGYVHNDLHKASGLIAQLETDNSTTVQNNIMAATKIKTAGWETGTSVADYWPLLFENSKTGNTFTNNRVAASTIFQCTHSNADAEQKAGQTRSFDEDPASEGLTTTDADMKTDNASFYTTTMGWDMTDTWTIFAEGQYPVLKWMTTSSAAPITISNASELTAYATKVNGGGYVVSAQLSADIDMNGVSFTPIGTSSNKFTGFFDGQGHKISNLTYSGTSAGIGLFGTILNATIQKVMLYGSTITGTGQNVGGIVGSASASTIQSCAVVNSQINGHDHVGAIAGNAVDWTTVTNNYSNADVVSDAYQVGGMIGVIKEATVTKNLFTGSVKGVSQDATGLISRVDGDDFVATISNNMIAASTITSTSGASVYSIINNYKLTNVTFHDNYLLDKTVYSDGSKVLNEKDDRNGKQESLSTFANSTFFDETLGWDMPNEWKMISGAQFPILEWMDEVYDYYIENAANLTAFATLVNDGNAASAKAHVVADIDASGVTYTPIGNRTHPYTGTFDGQTHSVTLSIDTYYSDQGLIGCAAGGAVIQNVITRGSVTGYKNCAGILGCVDDGTGTLTIRNCGNEANITANSKNAAGIQGGINWGGETPTITIEIINCYNTGTITGSNGESASISGYIGGSGTVTNCYNSGTLSGVDGDNKSFVRGEPTYTNCYTTLDANNAAGLNKSYSAEKVSSGELCYNLKGNQETNVFTQDLSQEGHPTFGSKTVETGSWFSDVNDVYFNHENGNYRVYSLNLGETNTKYDVPANVTVTDLKVTRYYLGNQWIGYCLPVTIASPGEWEVRELKGVRGSGEDATMLFSNASTITAGKPYLIKPNTDAWLTWSCGTASIISAADYATNRTITIDDISMIGNLEQVNISTGDFYINTSSQLKKLTAASATLNGFRAYFTVDGSSGVKALSFDFDGEETGISPLLTSPEEEGQIYNLAGQKLNKMQRGINIVNGKKILK